MISMTFELLGKWTPDDGSHENKYYGEALFWASPSLRRPKSAAHVYESLGKWEWYVFGPMAHQADWQGKEPTMEKAKAAAELALLELARAKK